MPLRLPSDHSVNSGSIDPEIEVGGPQPRPKPKLNVFKVAPRIAESRWVGPLPIAVGLIVLATGLGFAFRSVMNAEDPNYLRARDSVAAYETARPEIERNYDSPLYTDALAWLAKVKPGSVSAGPALELKDDIESRTAAFHRRVREAEEAERQAQEARNVRDADYLAARQRDVLTPKKDFPECKEDKGHGHAH